MNTLDEIVHRMNTTLALEHRPISGITSENALDVQAMCIAEEAGEFIGAFRRATNKARRSGTWAEVREEIADVLITAAAFADMMDWNLESLLKEKEKVIYRRGWKEAK